MSKLPYLQFFPADWYRDTRCLTPQTRGVWIDLICLLHDAPDRGRLTLPLSTLAAKLVVPLELCTASLTELQSLDVCHIEISGNNIVTVVSRRITREETQRNHTRKRVSAYRLRHPVTPQTRSSNGDIHIQKLESELHSSVGSSQSVTPTNGQDFEPVGRLVAQVLSLPESKATRQHGSYYALTHVCKSHPDQPMLAQWDLLKVSLVDLHCPICRGA